MVCIIAWYCACLGGMYKLVGVLDYLGMMGAWWSACIGVGVVSGIHTLGVVGCGWCVLKSCDTESLTETTFQTRNAETSIKRLWRDDRLILERRFHYYTITLSNNMTFHWKIPIRVKFRFLVDNIFIAIFFVLR